MTLDPWDMFVIRKDQMNMVRAAAYTGVLPAPGTERVLFSGFSNAAA